MRQTNTFKKTCFPEKVTFIYLTTPIKIPILNCTVLSNLWVPRIVSWTRFFALFSFNIQPPLSWFKSSRRTSNSNPDFCYKSADKQLFPPHSYLLSPIAQSHCYSGTAKNTLYSPFSNSVLSRTTHDSYTYKNLLHL